jgi:hypothetical protein
MKIRLKSTVIADRTAEGYPRMIEELYSFCGGGSRR